MAASSFERQVITGDATDDRTQARPDMADGPQQYEPTQSFLDHDRPAVRLVELPAWLQAFASSVGEPSESETPAAPESSPPEQPVSSSSSNSKNVPPGEPKTTRQSSASSASSDFISEDDLPEWLRSIAPEEGAERSFNALTVDGDGDREPITVPNITRAWSTSKDARGVNESTSLFALVASQAPQTALPDQPLDGVLDEGVGSSRPPSAGQFSGYGAGASPAESLSLEMPESVPSENTDVEVSRKFPILPVVAAAILLLVLIGAAAIMFVL